MLLTNINFIRLNSVFKFWCHDTISCNGINHISIPLFVEIVFVWIQQGKNTYFILVPTRSTIINRTICTTYSYFITLLSSLNENVQCYCTPGGLDTRIMT